MAQGKRNERTVEPTDSDKAYAAGFIDGEGCITVRVSPGTRNHKSWNPSMYASLTISQVDPRPLQWFQQRWGGSLRPLKRRRDGRNDRDAWEWCAVGRMAQQCFEDVRDMLKCKQEACDNAMRLGTLRKAKGAGNALTSEEVAVQADIRAEALRINGARPIWTELPGGLNHGTH
jgi:hypothetical protein